MFILFTPTIIALLIMVVVITIDVEEGGE